jgi:hypothetical protein
MRVDGYHCGLFVVVAHLILSPVFGTVGTVTSVVGLSLTPGSADGSGTDARLNKPAGVCIDPAGAFALISDESGHTVRKLDVATSTLTTLAGFAGQYGSVDSTGETARFSTPRGITCVNPTTALVADYGNQAIREITIGGAAVVTTKAGTLGAVTDVAVDPATRSFVLFSGYGSHTIGRVDLVTSTVSTVAGSTNVRGSRDGAGTDALFTNPVGVAINPTGSFALVTSLDHTIRKIDLTTSYVTTVAGLADDQGTSDGTGAAARFKNPAGIAIDPVRGLYAVIADYGNHAIRKMILSTKQVTTVAGFGGHMGTSDGTGSAARFYYPRAISIDPLTSTFALVADRNSHRIRKVVVALPPLPSLTSPTAFPTATPTTSPTAALLEPAVPTADEVANYTATVAIDDVTLTGLTLVQFNDPAVQLSIRKGFAREFQVHYNYIMITAAVANRQLRQDDKVQELPRRRLAGIKFTLTVHTTPAQAVAVSTVAQSISVSPARAASLASHIEQDITDSGAASGVTMGMAALPVPVVVQGQVAPVWTEPTNWCDICAASSPGSCACATVLTAACRIRMWWKLRADGATVDFKVALAAADQVNPASALAWLAVGLNPSATMAGTYTVIVAPAEVAAVDRVREYAVGSNGVAAPLTVQV